MQTEPRSGLAEDVNGYVWTREEDYDEPPVGRSWCNSSVMMLSLTWDELCGKHGPMTILVRVKGDS